VSKEFYATFNAFWLADIAVQTAYIQQAENVYTINNQQFQLIPYCDYKNEDKPSNAYLIYEDLWFSKNDLIKSRIKSVLGLNQKKHARQCQLKTLTKPEADNFFEENHLLGQSTYGVKMGLFINNECFAAMAWSKPRVFLDKQVYYHSYEMVRFASKMGFTLNGALSKLFNGFIQLKKPVHLMTYTDNDWGSAESFANLGFVKVGSSRNILFWVDPITHQRKYHLKENEIQTNLIVGYNTGSTKWIADLMQ
jgi:hypothetical protein